MTCEQFQELVALFLSVYALLKKLVEAVVSALQATPA